MERQRILVTGDLREIMHNIYYMRRGNVLTLQDGRNVLFMGGAHSVDKDAREPEVDWFPEEIIAERDLHNLPEDKDIDIVISHTCSNEIFEKLIKMSGVIAYNKDPSREALYRMF